MSLEKINQAIIDGDAETTTAEVAAAIEQR